MRVKFLTSNWCLTFRLTSRILPYYHTWTSNKKRRLGGVYRTKNRNWKCLFVDIRLLTFLHED